MCRVYHGYAGRPVRGAGQTEGFVGAPELSCTDDHWLLRPLLLTGVQDGGHRSRRACASRPFVRQVVPPAAALDMVDRHESVTNFFLYHSVEASAYNKTVAAAKYTRNADKTIASPVVVATAARIARRVRERTRSSEYRYADRRVAAQSPGNTAPVASAPSRSNRRDRQQFVRCFESSCPSVRKPFLSLSIPLCSLKHIPYFVTSIFKSLR